MHHLRIELFSLLVLPGTFAIAQTSPVQDSRAGVAKLVAQMERAQQATKSLRLRLDYRARIPGPAGTEPIEVTARMRVRSLRLPGRGPGAPARRYSRLDVDLDTAQGPLRTEKVRTPEGIWIHQASELTGEKWLRLDRATMEKLDRAAAAFGSIDALQSGSATASSVIGAELLKGLARSYDLRVGDDVMVGDELCRTVHAQLAKAPSSDLESLLPHERPDEIVLQFAKSDHLLRRMVQSADKKPVATLTLSDVEIDPKLDPADFRLVPPEGVRFRDIMADKIASARIRMDLERLAKLEAERKGKK